MMYFLLSSSFISIRYYVLLMFFDLVYFDSKLNTGATWIIGLLGV